LIPPLQLDLGHHLPVPALLSKTPQSENRESCKHLNSGIVCPIPPRAASCAARATSGAPVLLPWRPQAAGIVAVRGSPWRRARGIVGLGELQDRRWGRVDWRRVEASSFAGLCAPAICELAGIIPGLQDALDMVLGTGGPSAQLAPRLHPRL